MPARYCSLIIFLLCLLTFNPLHADASPKEITWFSYPEDLPAFDYSGDKLKQYWPLLAKASHLAFPDEGYLAGQMKRYPLLVQRLQEWSQDEHAHPSLKEAAAGNLQPLALALQQVWRLHFEGDFAQACTMGKELGPPGLMPALYAQLMHNTLLETDQDIKLAVYRKVSEEIEALLPLTPDNDFALFGLAYAQARELELLSTSAATATGYLDKTRDSLAALSKRFPERALYYAMTGGLHAGVVERVGSFIGRMTYSMGADGALESFSKTFELEKSLPVLYYEHAKALIRLDDDDYLDDIHNTLTQCLKIQVYNAEEALNQSACARLLSDVTKQN